MQTKLDDKVRELWPRKVSSNVSSEQKENDGVYTVSAVVRLPDEGDSDNRPLLPLFSCPRRYSDFLQGSRDSSGYLRERFEETDVLGPIAMALKAHSVKDSLKLILTAFPPRDTIMIEATPEAESTFPSYFC